MGGLEVRGHLAETLINECVANLAITITLMSRSVLMIEELRAALQKYCR